MARCIDQKAIFHGVMYFDVPADNTFSLDKARDGALRAVKGTLLTEKVIELDGYSGREVSASGTASNGDKLVLRARIYLIQKRVYAILLLVPKSYETNLSSPMAARYFDSFQLLKP